MVLVLLRGEACRALFVRTMQVSGILRCRPPEGALAGAQGPLQDTCGESTGSGGKRGICIENEDANIIKKDREEEEEEMRSAIAAPSLLKGA